MFIPNAGLLYIGKIVTRSFNSVENKTIKTCLPRQYIYIYIYSKTWH